MSVKCRNHTHLFYKPCWYRNGNMLQDLTVALKAHAITIPLQSILQRMKRMSTYKEQLWKLRNDQVISGLWKQCSELLQMMLIYLFLFHAHDQWLVYIREHTIHSRIYGVPGELGLCSSYSLSLETIPMQCPSLPLRSKGIPGLLQHVCKGKG